MSHRILLHDALGVLAEIPGVGITHAVGTSVPASASPGFAPGCIFSLLSFTGAQLALYQNLGTLASCSFVSLLTIPAGRTLAITDADLLTVGGLIVPQHVELNFYIMPHASATKYSLWTAPAAYQVVAINVTPSLVQGGALTGTLCKAVTTATPSKSTTPFHTADAIDLNATAHTVQPITLSSTTADLQLAAGNRIGLDLSAALSTGHAQMSVRLKRI